MNAVLAIHPATNLGFGLTLKMKNPLMIIPTPITRIPPTPERNQNQNCYHIEYMKTTLQPHHLQVDKFSVLYEITFLNYNFFLDFFDCFLPEIILADGVGNLN